MFVLSLIFFKAFLLCLSWSSSIDFLLFHLYPRICSLSSICLFFFAFWAAATIQTLLAPFAFPFPFLLPSGKESQFEGVEIKAEDLIELIERNYIRAE